MTFYIDDGGRWRRVYFFKDRRLRVEGWARRARLLKRTLAGCLVPHATDPRRLKPGPKVMKRMKCPKQKEPDTQSSNKTNSFDKKKKKYENAQFLSNTSPEKSQATHKNPIKHENPKLPDQIQTCENKSSPTQNFFITYFSQHMSQGSNKKDEVISKKPDRISLSNKRVRTKKLNPTSPAFVKTVQKIITESDSSSETDALVKEIIITEEVVSILRRYLKKKNTNVDLKRFDNDDTYKTRLFYKICPLVTLERCSEITKLLAENTKKCKAKTSINSNKKDLEPKLKRATWIHMTSSSEDSSQSSQSSSINSSEGSSTNDIDKSKKPNSPPLKKDAMVFLPKDFATSNSMKTLQSPKKDQYLSRKTRQREPSTSTSEDFQVQNKSPRVRPKRSSTTISATKKREPSTSTSEDFQVQNKSPRVRPKRSSTTTSATRKREPSTSTSEDFQVQNKSPRVRPKRSSTTISATRKREPSTSTSGDFQVQNKSPRVRPRRSTTTISATRKREPSTSTSEDVQVQNKSPRVRPRRSTTTISATRKREPSTSTSEDVQVQNKSPRVRPRRSTTTISATRKRVVNSEDKENEKIDRELRSTLPTRSAKTKKPLTNDQNTNKNGKNEEQKKQASPKLRDKNRKPVAVPKRSSVAPGREYSSFEDHAIIAWLDKAQERQRLVSGNVVWKNLQDEYFAITKVRRTWHSLRNRYLRYILPSIWKLGLPSHQVQRLIANYGTGDLRQNKKRRKRDKPTSNSLLVLPTVKSAYARRPKTNDDASVIYKRLDDSLPLKATKPLLRSSGVSAAVKTPQASGVQHTSREKSRAQTIEQQAASPKLRKRPANESQRSPNVGGRSPNVGERSPKRRALRRPERDSSPISYSEITKRFAMQLRSTPQNSGSSAAASPARVLSKSATRHRRRLYNPS